MYPPLFLTPLEKKDEGQLEELLAEGDRIKRALDANTPDND